MQSDQETARTFKIFESVTNRNEAFAIAGSGVYRISKVDDGA